MEEEFRSSSPTVTKTFALPEWCSNSRHSKVKVRPLKLVLFLDNNWCILSLKQILWQIRDQAIILVLWSQLHDSFSWHTSSLSYPFIHHASMTFGQQSVTSLGKLPQNVTTTAGRLMLFSTHLFHTDFLHTLGDTYRNMCSAWLYIFHHFYMYFLYRGWNLFGKRDLMTEIKSR